MHTRVVHCEGFLREDGLWDIEASIIDSKPFPYTEPVRGLREPGSEVHHMAIRVTVGTDMMVHAVEVAMPATPYPVCAEAAPSFQGLLGHRIDGGWRAAVRDAVGAERGCTHARELLFPLATVAFQTIHGWSEDDDGERPEHAKKRDSKPYFIGGCRAWAADGPLVATLYPAFASPRRAEP